jgi:predicted double-glycine peptidase
MTGNASAIMKDIDILNKVVSEHVTTQDESFLHSEVNLSKFSEIGNNMGISPSELKEKEVRIQELHSMIVT